MYPYASNHPCPCVGFSPNLRLTVGSSPGMEGPELQRASQKRTLFGFKCQTCPQNIKLVDFNHHRQDGNCWNMLEPPKKSWLNWLKHLETQKKKEGATPALTLVLICSPSVIPKANKGCLTESPIPCVFIVTNNIIKWQVTTILGVDFSKCSIFAAGLLFTQHQNFQPQPTTAATTRAHCTSCATGGRSQRFNVPQLQTAKRTDPGAWQGTDFPVHGC